MLKLAEEKYKYTLGYWKRLMNIKTHPLRRKDILLTLQRSINMHGLYSRQFIQKQKNYCDFFLYAKSLPLGNDMLYLNNSELITMLEFVEDENRNFQEIHDELDHAIIWKNSHDHKKKFTILLKLTCYLQERIFLFEA